MSPSEFFPLINHSARQNACCALCSKMHRRCTIQISKLAVLEFIARQGHPPARYCWTSCLKSKYSRASVTKSLPGRSKASGRMSADAPCDLKEGKAESSLSIPVFSVWLPASKQGGQEVCGLGITTALTRLHPIDVLKIGKEHFTNPLHEHFTTISPD